MNQPMHQPNITFIGAGNMTTAIIAGLIGSGYSKSKITASNPSNEKLEMLATKYGINITSSNSEAIAQSDIIILGVKPGIVPIICGEISESIAEQMVISVAAGVTIETINNALSNDNLVIRAMPNTPCLVGKGAIGLYTASELTIQRREFINGLFDSLGQTVWVKTEHQINIVTALSGSGPAYYFYLTEALIKAGIELGLEPEVSSMLVNQTAQGSVAMLNNAEQLSAAALRQAVTSPKGTTEAATHVFDQHELMQIIEKAVSAATERGVEMAQLNK